VLCVLHESGVPVKETSIQRGVQWLKTHQRESGRWFTRSLNQDGGHVISNAQTAFAVMALEACNPKATSQAGDIKK
jgi:squalene-hopene/tetraprenyl-beta-curcumene cyclase